MNKVCKDLLVLRDRLANRRGHQRRRFNEEIRVTQEFPAPQVTQAIQDLLVHPVDRREKKENQENQANEENQAKMVIQVLQDSLELKESPAYQVLLEGMAREDLKVTVDTQVLQEW